MKEIATTEEIYGVSPVELAKMTYEEALLVKMAGLIKRKKEITDELFRTDDPYYSGRLQMQ